MAERHSAEELVVLLGTPTAESSRLCALSVTSGDPSWAGALAGEALGLPAYHITEPEIKEQIDSATYDLEVGLADIALDAEAIGRAIKEVRGG